MTSPIFVHAPFCCDEKDIGVCGTKELIKNKFDYSIDNKCKEPIVELYDIVSNKIDNKILTDKCVVIGGDQSISLPTIYAINDIAIRNNKHLILIVIDHSFDCDEIDNMNKSAFRDISNSAHQLPVLKLINPGQIIFIGIQDTEKCLDYVDDNDIKYITLDKLNKHDVKPIISSIIDDICENEKINKDDIIIHVSIDAGSLDGKIAPSATRFHDENSSKDTTDIHNYPGLIEENIVDIFTYLSNQFFISSVDICNFNTKIGNYTDIRKTAESVRLCSRKLLNIKEKTLNIYNEDSKFVIFRPIEQIDCADAGWYILSGMDVDVKTRLIKHIGDDNIITDTIGDDEILLTTTTIREQNMKTYHRGVNINDSILFPSEKTIMLFELVGNPEK